MGMAASQARYLALVARKSNCEYEGQQINQARTALANQSANLFNQMLGLQVPVPPSTQDFTKTQYSFTDGINSSTIDSWQQLGTNNSEYNYVVTHHYYADRYTGSLKKLTDPQVQFPADFVSLQEIQLKQAAVALKENSYNISVARYDSALKDYNDAYKKKIDLNSYKLEYTDVTNAEYDSTAMTYKVTHGGTDTTYTNYEKLNPAQKTEADEILNKLKTQGALAADFDNNKVFYDPTSKQLVFKDDLNAAAGGDSKLRYFTEAQITSKVTSINDNVSECQTRKNDAKADMDTLKEELDALNNEYLEMGHPTSIGNCELTPLSVLTKDQKAELDQVVKDMLEQGIETDITNCFNADGSYVGGIYQFKLNGTTYYTTYNNLMTSYQNGVGNNNIDEQPKLAYYNASYVSTKIEKTQNALVETDGVGRFSTIKFEDDSITYTLNMETITDDVAYKDAMNQYYYENAKYDKMVQDINARTSIIQQEDRTLELRLKQLDTEQKALSTEMEAVKKVVDSNVESSFKTFNG